MMIRRPIEIGDKVFLEPCSDIVDEIDKDYVDTVAVVLSHPEVGFYRETPGEPYCEDAPATVTLEFADGELLVDVSVDDIYHA